MAVGKNQRGLRIHQGKTGCQRVRPLEQRIASMASEAREYSSQETTHSTDELSAQETARGATWDPVMDEDDPLLELLNYSQDTSSQPQEQEAIPDRPRPMPTTRTLKIKWPKASEKAPWKQFSRGPRHHPRIIHARSSTPEVTHPYYLSTL